MAVSLLCIVFGVIAYKQNKARRLALLQLAQAKGWVFNESGDQVWVDAFSCYPFQTGHTRSVTMSLAGQVDGCEFVAMDYQYYTTETRTTTSAKGSTSTSTYEQKHPYRVTAVRTGIAGVPLNVASEGFFGRLVDAITNSDIDFEDEEFNRRFKVRCDDRKFAYAIITPQVMETLKSAPGGRVAWCDGYIVHADSGRWQAEQIEPAVRRLTVLAADVPSYLRDQPPAGAPGSAPQG